MGLCTLTIVQDEIKLDCVAGHSLGEYAALVVSGVLSLEEVVLFIKKRGEVFYDAFKSIQRHGGYYRYSRGASSGCVGAVVSKDVPEYALALGVPAKVVKCLNS